MSVNIADYMTKIMQDQERKKAEQDRLLNSIKSSQAMSQVARPAADLIDFLSGINPRQKGTKIAETMPSEADEQRINTALAGYTIPDNKEMLALIKIMQDGKKEKTITDNVQVYDRVNKELKDVRKEADQKVTSYSKLDNALAFGGLSDITNHLATIAKGLGSEVSRLTDQDVNRALARTAKMDVAKVRAYFSGDPYVKMDDTYIRKLKNAVDRGRLNTYEDISKAIKGRKDVAAKSPFLGQYMGEELYGGYFSEADSEYQNRLGITDTLVNKQNKIKQIREFKKGLENIPPEQAQAELDKIVDSMIDLDIQIDEI